MRRVATLGGEAALSLDHDTIEESGADATVLVARFAAARQRCSRVMATPRAAFFVAQLAELVHAHHASGGEGVLGAFDPSLIVETDAGDRLIAPGMVRITQQHDSGMRGLRGGTLVSHYRVTHDQLRAKPGVPDEVTSLAVLFIELVSGKEPYPTSDQFAYMTAVTAGAHLSLDELLPNVTQGLRTTLARALLIEASARPTLDGLKSALRAEPGVAELAHRSTSPSPTANTKPWWKFW